MFAARLKATLALTMGTTEASIAAGAIKRIVADVSTYAFDAEVTFAISSEQVPDPIFASFTTPSLIAAKLSVTNYSVAAGAENPNPLALTGYVTEKRIAETVGPAIADVPVVTRLYTIRFSDAAQVFWRQHFPIELYVDASMREVISLHAVAGMRLTYDFDRLDEAREILCLPLSADRGVSFYDFVFWFIRDNHGVVELNASSGEYRIGAKKARSGAEISTVFDDVAAVRIFAPDVQRHITHVMNPFAELASNTVVANAHAAGAVRRDVFAYAPVSATVERRIALETRRSVESDHEIEITYERFPEQVPTPGALATFDEEFSEKQYIHNRTYRVVSLHLECAAEAEPPNDVAEDEDPIARFAFILSSRLELQSNKAPHLPRFQCPVYPILVEGRVVSASGGDTDRTWFAAENGSDSLYRCRCDIPLWNKQVVLPFTPNRSPGHFFFPPYKHHRVLVSLDFGSAKIHSFLEWADNAKLPAETQGDKIAFGYGAENGTTVQHSYVDEKPVLTVLRRLGGDQETLVLSEGVIRFEVREDPTVAKVEPKFDVVGQVNVAKERVASGIKSSVGVLSGKFEGAIGDVSGSVEAATADVTSQVEAAEATLVGKIEAVEATLVGLAASGKEALLVVAAKVPAAKAEITAALMG